MQVGQVSHQRVANALSADHPTLYVHAAGGDLSNAVRLYEWNLATSGTLYEALGVLEVVLRNASSARLAEHQGGAPTGYW